MSRDESDKASKLAHHNKQSAYSGKVASQRTASWYRDNQQLDLHCVGWLGCSNRLVSLRV